MAQTITLRVQGATAGQGAPLEVAAIVARFQVLHFAGLAGCNPLGKMLEFDGIGGRRDPATSKPASSAARLTMAFI